MPRQIASSLPGGQIETQARGAEFVFTGSQGIGSKLPRSVKAAALAMSLGLSALLPAAGLRSPVLPNAHATLLSQVAIAIHSWTLRQGHPRAPPIQVAVPNWNLVGSPH